MRFAAGSRVVWIYSRNFVTGARYWSAGTVVGPYNEDTTVVAREQDWRSDRIGWQPAEFDFYASNDLETVRDVDLVAWADEMANTGPEVDS